MDFPRYGKMDKKEDRFLAQGVPSGRWIFTRDCHRRNGKYWIGIGGNYPCGKTGNMLIYTG
jgi:hypothetical protein